MFDCEFVWINGGEFYEGNETKEKHKNRKQIILILLSIF